jgi:hypothetical protein
MGGRAGLQWHRHAEPYDTLPHSLLAKATPSSPLIVICSWMAPAMKDLGVTSEPGGAGSQGAEDLLSRYAEAAIGPHEQWGD